MPKRNEIKKVLVIGSGPIIIGQAAEFDYSGTQACKSLREEGIEVVLINSNPATIMTDLDVADKIYIEPITIDIISKILYKEQPDGILATLGGQTGLNISVALHESGILGELGIELLGTSIHSIQLAEDRDMFKKTMESIHQKVPLSQIVTTLNQGADFAKCIGFPIIIRPAYTLGGTGGGIAHDMDEFLNICAKGLKNSIIHQVLVEQSVAGWKEIEYEAIRDNGGNCVIVCSMENFDPVGIHTGDSIVVVPTQTLAEEQHMMLKNASINIVNALDIKGACNIQFALNPDSNEYAVIEVNPRVSRSSALASKATGYPIARIASKIALGFNLNEIPNPITQSTFENFEPVVDYIVTKVPRWPFDKFVTANKTLGTQMKATGEVMAIGKTFEESLLKAIDSLDIRLNYHLGMKEISSWNDYEIEDSLKNPDDERIFVVSEALNRGYTVDQIHELTNISELFIEKLKNINDLSHSIQNYTIDNLPIELFFKCKKYGLADSYIAELLDSTEEAVNYIRKEYNIKPYYGMITATTGIHGVKAPYYSSYKECYYGKPTEKTKVIVLGSGPIRIGQGIEFDYCSVHSVKALKEQQVEAIIINNNPETVSTDFDTSDILYFEPLTKECVMDVIERENPLGVIVQFGGQTAINLAASLNKAGVQILGTSVHNMDIAEDRDKFIKLLDKLGIPAPAGKSANSEDQALAAAHSIGYPVLVRPSYVLGGRGMEIVHNDHKLIAYLDGAIKAGQNQTVLIDKYICGKEVEIDAISDGVDVVIAGIMEHIERAGVHSGDSFAIYPTQTISAKAKEDIVKYTISIARALNIKGLLNIQFVIDGDDNVMVLEVNPRASRTVPILSKVTGIPIVALATNVMLGKTLKQFGYTTGLIPHSTLITVKAPVFSFSKLTTVDTFLGPEMKSTGEVMGVDKTLAGAMKKALLASGLKIPSKGNALVSVSDRDKEDIIGIVDLLNSFGFQIYATDGTYEFLSHKGFNINLLTKNEIVGALKEDKIDIIINTPTRGKDPGRLGFKIRRTSMEFNIPCITSIDTAKAALSTLEYWDNDMEIIPVNEYYHDPNNTYADII